MRLSSSALASLSSKVAGPRYTRSVAASQIVHIGVGGFHRAHEAVYLDDLANLDAKIEWGLCGVGLRLEDRAMRDALLPQDCLYTVVARSAQCDEARVVGALTDYLFAPDAPRVVIERLAAPQTRIVSLTITEGGYHLESPSAPNSTFAVLAEALERRRKQNTPPFTVLSCDNLQKNGDRARAALLSAADRRETSLPAWIAQNVAFPNCMVDRITPQTTDADREMVRDEFGIEDAWPVVTEPFRQWILEDKFSDGRPELERVGVQFTSEVHPYEMMKIRLLNASHSAMGYLGFLAGYRTIPEIIEDTLFHEYIRRLMDDEITPLLLPVPGVDLAEYRQTLLTRFANPTIKDQVSRICLDGSSKVPQFVLPSLHEALAQGQPTKLLTLAAAGWMRYLSGVDEQGRPFAINDPMAARLQVKAREGRTDPRPLLSLTEFFGDLGQSEALIRQIGDALIQLYADGARKTLTRALA